MSSPDSGSAPTALEILKELENKGCNAFPVRLSKISLMPGDDKLVAIEYTTYFGAKEALLISPNQLREAVHHLFDIALSIGAIELPQPSINLCPSCQTELLEEADRSTKH